MVFVESNGYKSCVCEQVQAEAFHAAFASILPTKVWGTSSRGEAEVYNNIACLRLAYNLPCALNLIFGDHDSDQIL